MYLLRNEKYIKDDYVLDIVHSIADSKLEMYIKNTKHNISFKIERDTKVGIEIENDIYSNVFGKKTETNARIVYDDAKIFNELFSLGKQLIDFFIELEKMIIEDESKKRDKIIEAIGLTTKIFSEV